MKISKISVYLIFFLTTRFLWAQTTADLDNFYKTYISNERFDIHLIEKIVLSNQPLLWDTTENVYRYFLTRYDTTQKNNFFDENEYRIRLFRKMVKDVDYVAFKKQVANQGSKLFKKSSVVWGNKKSKRGFVDLRLSNPILSADKRMLIILDQRVIKGEGYSKMIRVYLWEDGYYKLWDSVHEFNAGI